MSDKLLPCPFCGGEARLTKLNQKGFNGEFKVFVRCSRCKARSNVAYPMPHYSLKAREDAAISAWNNRRAEPVAGFPTTENAPLALDELRGMDGEPVTVVSLPIGSTYKLGQQRDGKQFLKIGTARKLSDYGKTWLAYRRKPEEATE